MSEVRNFVLADKDDHELDDECDTIDKAQLDAARSGCAVVAQVDQYSDAAPVWTPAGSNVWPPK